MLAPGSLSTKRRWPSTRRPCTSPGASAWSVMLMATVAHTSAGGRHDHDQQGGVMIMIMTREGAHALSEDAGSC